jgi:hypothetical protein
LQYYTNNPLGKILFITIIIGALAGFLIPTKIFREIVWWCIKAAVKIALFLFIEAIVAFLTFLVISLWDA